MFASGVWLIIRRTRALDNKPGDETLQKFCRSSAAKEPSAGSAGSIEEDFPFVIADKRRTTVSAAIAKTIENVAVGLPVAGSGNDK